MHRTPTKMNYFSCEWQQQLSSRLTRTVASSEPSEQIQQCTWRMWVQRFPQSSLSDAWEQDVRASLERHKQKIAELSKELEQETLYVEYLERLLGDVEKYREAGGDPSTLFEANSPASAANVLAGGSNQLREQTEKADGTNDLVELEEVVSGVID
uniref:Uncharacterized protein n=1 Tax=Anopheles culicifacies TaxID=139723 RepID=A0A182LZF1_9DIPT